MKFILYYKGDELTSHSDNYGSGWSGWRYADGTGLDIESPTAQAAEWIRARGSVVDAIEGIEEALWKNRNDRIATEELSQVMSELQYFS